MGKIRQKCLDKVIDIAMRKKDSFSLDIQITDTRGVPIAKGQFHDNGKVTVFSNPSLGIKSRRYENPSAMRQDIVARNQATYRYIKYQGKTLSTRGVSG